MKHVDTKECKVHVLVCTNERPPGKSCCKKVGGQEFYQSIKDKLKKDGLYGTHWVTRTGCLGFCNDVGTTVVIKPTGKPEQWYSEVTAADFGMIWEEILKA